MPPKDELQVSQAQEIKKEPQTIAADLPVPFEEPALPGPLVVSSRLARRKTMEAVSQLQNRQQQLEQRRLQPPVSSTGQQPEQRLQDNALSAQEAQDIFGGDLSQLSFDATTNTFIPKEDVSPVQMQKVKSLRTIDQQFSHTIQRIQPFLSSSNPHVRAIADTYRQSIERRSQLIRNLIL